MATIILHTRTGGVLQALKSMIFRSGDANSARQTHVVEPSHGGSRPLVRPLLDRDATYFLGVPYEKTLKLLRAAIKREGLRLPMEMDVSGRIRDELGIGLRPCRILYVDCPFLLLQAAVWGGCGAAFLPLRAVVSRSGGGTTIHLPGPMDAGVPPGLRVPFERFVSRFLMVLEEIGARRVDGRATA